MDRERFRIVLPSHPLLGRNVNHDSESRRYSVRIPATVAWQSVRHESSIGILDQGSLGSCTGNAGLESIYRQPFMTDPARAWTGLPPTEAGAVALYSAATKIDPFGGEYPPEDTGSDGLSIAKVLKSKGIVSGYLWAFTLYDAVAQLLRTPVITGVPWYESMFSTVSTGHAGHVVVDTKTKLAGGHELCADELIVGSAPDSTMADWWVGGPNSWGDSWGDHGRWYWTVPEWGSLLADQGDVTAFVPLTSPAPDPAPVPGPDDTLWRAVRSWSHASHTGGNARAAKAVREWAKATGRA